MKPVLYTLILLFAHTAFAQTVPSSCTGPDSIMNKYTDDADYATLAYTDHINSTYADSTAIWPAMSDTVLRAMIAVYNATTLPARDSVVTMYHVHDYRVSLLKGIELIADKNAGYMVQIQSGNIPTGFVPFDDLVNKYHLHVVSKGNTPAWAGAYTVHFISDSNYNIAAVGNEFLQLPNMWSAKTELTIGDGHYITVDSVTGTYTDLTYSFGWMDCPSGCVWRHNWHFRIGDDCSVTYKGSSGTPVPPASIEGIDKRKFRIYPNPVSEVLHIEGVSMVDYSIYNTIGQVVRSGITKGDISVQHLPGGTYFISLKDKEATVTRRFIKQGGY